VSWRQSASFRSTRPEGSTQQSHPSRKTLATIRITDIDKLIVSYLEVVQFLSAAFRRIYTRRTSPETKFGERSSDAVQAYARVRAEHGKRRALPSPEFSLNARIPTLPNCVREGDFNLASTALQNCTTSLLGSTIACCDWLRSCRRIASVGYRC
jgi:hypothetical protein